MGAREKLNIAHLNGSLLLATLVGGLAQSWPAFFVTLTVLLGLNLYLHEIRPQRPGRRDGKR
jgi:4-hydroxybenzoate polyprenyltransferase